MESGFRIGDKRVVVLTGAGISAESGIKTFRDIDGMWRQYQVSQVASPEAFRKDPEMVWEFYKLRYNNLLEAKPNAGHYALTELEQALGERFSLITQNVDGLHLIAGSRNVLEMHGNLHNCFCTECGSRYKMKDVDLSSSVPICPSCGGNLRPDVVWFGEVPRSLPKISEKMEECGLFIVVGTSGTVYPASALVGLAQDRGAETIGVNLEPPENREYLEEFHQGKAGEILPLLVKELLRGE